MERGKRRGESVVLYICYFLTVVAVHRDRDGAAGRLGLEIFWRVSLETSHEALLI